MDCCLPNSFISVAEDSGLIVPIGEWVLHEACTQAARWPSSVSLAVNLSPAHFKKGRELVRQVKLALDAASFPADRLELEITESVLLANDEFRAAHPTGVERSRSTNRIGRFRHRLFVAELSSPLSLRQNQDRSIVRSGLRSERRRIGYRQGGHCAGT